MWTIPTAQRETLPAYLNEAGNVLGMMPHPERVISPLLGGTDGVTFFKGIVEAAA